MGKLPYKDLYFVHIPKNAGSSIEEVGLINDVKWGKEFFNNELYKAEINGRHLKLAYWHLPYNDRVYDKTADQCFCVVRDPYTRIISDFNYLGSKNDYYKQMSLNDFIGYVLIHYYHCQYFLDNHQRPQSEYVYHEGEKIVDHVIRFENIEEEFKKLTGLELSKKINVSKGASLSPKDISDKNIHLINYFYYEDFENFGYDRINRI